MFECFSRGIINRKYLPSSNVYTTLVFMIMSSFGIYQFLTDYESFPQGTEKAFIMAIQPKPNEEVGVIGVFWSKGNLLGW